MSKKLPSTSTDSGSQAENDSKKQLAWPKQAAPDDPIFTRGFQFGTQKPQGQASEEEPIVEEDNSAPEEESSPPFAPLESGEEEGWEPVTSLRNVRELVANQTPRPTPKASSAQELEDYDPYQAAADRFGITRQEAKDSSTI